MLLILVLSLVAVILLAIGAIRIFSSNSSLTLAKIGISIPEDEAVTEYVTSFIESMDSVKSICRFEYMDEQDAIREFNEGKLQAAVVFPAGFYHDVQVGLNPPAVIYFPKNPGLVGSMFKEVLTSGVSYLQTAESGVYAAIDTAYAYESAISIADIGQLLALEYLSAVLQRDRFYNDSLISAMGDITLAAYYFAAGTVIILAFCGVTFGFMYKGSSKAISDKLRINGLGRPMGALARILAMFPYVFLMGMLTYFAGLAIGAKIDDPLIKYRPQAWVAVALVSFLFAFYFEIIYDLTGRGRTGIFVLCIINIIGISVSGLVIPLAYMSDTVSFIGRFSPFGYAADYLSEAFFAVKGGVL